MPKLVKMVTCVFLLAGCAAKVDAPPDDLGSTADSDRPTFEEFRAATYQDADGSFIYDGDLVAPDEEALRGLYDEMFPLDGALIVQSYGGRDRVWTGSQKYQLSYCVSTSFGTRYSDVVAAMEQATDDWMQAADLGFVHASEEDGNCTASNPNVLFDVRPTNVTSYLARAFFPGYPRSSRNILVSTTSFRSRTPLVGILRHELGHVLGFLHEHIRRPNTPCPEGGSGRGVTAYDPSSVMHYPQCGGSNYGLELSATDVAGAREVYGSPVSGSPEPEPEPDPDPEPDPTGTPRSGSASSSVARGRTVAFQPLPVVPGSTFTVNLSGSGDADLYVRFGARPTTSAYDCRPYAGDSNETCSLTVPAGQGEAYISVQGYTASTFRIDASWVAP